MHEELRIERLKRRLSQWRLSQITGIIQSRISLFENGLIELKDEEIVRIREALRK